MKVSLHLRISGRALGPFSSARGFLPLATTEVSKERVNVWLDVKAVKIVHEGGKDS